MIPRAFIDDLVARSDIVEIIDGYVSLRKKGKNYTACCPFHEEKTPSFTVSQEKQFYYCFGCGAGGNVLSFLMDYARLDFIEAVHDLAARLGIEVPRDYNSAETENAQQREKLYQILARAAQWFQQQLQQHPQAGRAREYLVKRGLDAAMQEAFSLGYAPPGWDNLYKALGGAAQQEILKAAGLLVEKDTGNAYDRFRERVIFPIHDPRGRVVGFGGRVLDDSLPKYLNSPETLVFQKGRELYGLYFARRERPAVERMVVVEGYMDVAVLARHGIRNAVATLGTAVGEEHLKSLFRSVNDIVFCFDGDEAGRKAAQRALEVSLPLLREGRSAAFAFLPQGEDPDSLVTGQGGAAFEAFIKNALSAADFLFQTLARQMDTNKLEGRARLLETAAPFLNKLPEGATKRFITERLRDVDTRNLSRVLPTQGEVDAGRAAALGSAARAGGRYTARQRSSTPSPMRTSIGLLIQNPHLAEQIDAPTRAALNALQQEGAELLHGLLEFIQEHPHVHTGAILEHWRNTEYAGAVKKLAAWPHQLPDSGIERELMDALRNLLKAEAEQDLEALLQKSQLGPLSNEEKQKLKFLLSSKT